MSSHLIGCLWRIVTVFKKGMKRLVAGEILPPRQVSLRVVYNTPTRQSAAKTSFYFAHNSHLLIFLLNWSTLSFANCLSHSKRSGSLQIFLLEMINPDTSHCPGGRGSQMACSTSSWAQATKQQKQAAPPREIDETCGAAVSFALLQRSGAKLTADSIDTPFHYALKEEKVGKSFNISLFTYFDCLLHRNTF